MPKLDKNVPVLDEGLRSQLETQNPPLFQGSYMALASHVEAAHTDVEANLGGHTSVEGDDPDIEPFRGPGGYMGSTEEDTWGSMPQLRDL